MSKLIFAVFLLTQVIIVRNLYAQNSSDSIPFKGDEIIKKGVELFDNGKYEEAIKVFKHVSPCDPNYSKACYEMAYTYDSMGDVKTAFQKCREAIALDSTDVQTFIMKGNLLDKLGRSKEAIEWMTFVEKTYPYNQSLLYNLGICYLNSGDILKAEATLLKGIHYNPYHAKSHFTLAKINYMMGRTAQSYLAYNMAIVMNPRLDFVTSFEETIGGKIDSLSKGYLYPYPKEMNHAQWDTLSGLLNAEVAFREDFPYEYKLNYLTCRQTVLLFNKMKFEEKDTSLYNQFYVRFFKNIVERNEMETFLFYTFKSSGNKQVTDWMTANVALNDSFVNHAKQDIDKWKNYGFSTIKEANHQKVYHFDDDGDLESVGILNETPQPVKEGLWRYIRGTGAISQRGNYRNNLEEGEVLKYWPDGSIKQKLNFKNGNYDGLNYTFYPSGVKSGVFPRNNDIPDGVQEEYNSAGKLYSRIPYKNGKIEGISLFIDYSNGFKREIPYDNNKCEGKATEYWLNGNKKLEAMYSDSLLNGSLKKWYANENLEWEGNYTKGKLTGKWISYHSNGTKSAEGTYDESGSENLVGTSTQFDYRGNMISQVSGYNEGKSNGTETNYFTDGKVQSNFVVSDNVIKHIEYFDLSGNKLYAADEKEGELHYKSFFTEGMLKMEGMFKDGVKTGLWKEYNVSGKLISESNWLQGLESGEQKSYYSNGKLQLVYVCDSGKVLGEVKKYFRNGHLYFNGYYDSEGPAGPWTTYYSNDSIENVAYFVDGKLAGRRMSYSPEGKLTTEEKFDSDGECLSVKYFDMNGKQYDVTNFLGDSATYQVHYPNGKLKAKLCFVDRKKNGMQEYYYPNGQLKMKEPFIYGNAEGECRQWDHKGKPVYIKTYRMNQLDGKWYGYENGKLDFIDNYEMGTDNGFYVELYPNGHQKRTYEKEGGIRKGICNFLAPDSTWMYSVQYRNNEACAVSYFDKTGKLHSNEKVDTATKEIICYYKSGKIAARIPFNNGIYQGKYAIYYPTGQLISETSYVDDYREGQAKSCFENGSVKELTNWHNGDKHGNYTLYFANGKKAVEGMYQADKKCGKWTFYNESGKIVETLSYFDDEVYEIN